MSNQLRILFQSRFDHRQHTAHVVLFDPQRDIAVLDVPGLTASPLQFADNGQAGDVLFELGNVADGFAGHGPWPEVDAGLAALERSAAGGELLPDGAGDSHIAAWHAAYRAFGTNPKRERPSVDALIRGSRPLRASRDISMPSTMPT